MYQFVFPLFWYILDSTLSRHLPILVLIIVIKEYTLTQHKSCLT